MDSGNKYKLATLLILLHMLASCQNQVDPEFPDVGIDKDKLNLELEIIHLTPNYYTINEPIKLMVRLHSDIEIYSENDFGARMFIPNMETGQWEEIYDSVTSYSEELNIELNDIIDGTDEMILSTRDENKLVQRAITLHPEIESNNKSVRMLIVVIGNIYENETVTDRKVGAYTLITLQP